MHCYPMGAIWLSVSHRHARHEASESRRGRPDKDGTDHTNDSNSAHNHECRLPAVTPQYEPACNATLVMITASRKFGCDCHHKLRAY
jgi:hypothetical protein